MICNDKSNYTYCIIILCINIIPIVGAIPVQVIMWQK